MQLDGVKLEKDLGPAPQNVDLAAPKTGSFSMEISVNIVDQDGPGFYGTKQSSRASEPTTGMVDYDNTHVYLVDNDGTTTCTLVAPGRMNCIYIEVNAVDSIASR